ncbi:MAG: LPP20 family lipoprotein [Bacteroidales bacterium]|nr:LPP20 family lipoprotein [Bacteroidales bacterium]MBP5764926.1 LPP20 family lipoprotein [Bacteroidales bacterium]
MKRLFAFFSSMLAVLTLSAQPSWVTQHPVSDTEYMGVGFALLSESDYVQKATSNALADIASQIAIKVDASSFIHTIDIDGKSRELFEEKVQNSMAAYLEGQEMRDSYQDGNKYYVLYALNKRTYQKNLENHRQKAVAEGWTYYERGMSSMEVNDLVNAVTLFAKGLEAVEPWLFTDLTRKVNGKTVSVPAELYDAYLNVFAGMAITTNVAQLQGEIYKAIPQTIAACLSRDGIVVANVPLEARFVVGDGSVSPALNTDFNGTAEFHVLNITSKAAVQELRITLSDTFLSALPEAYRQIIKKQSWPEAKVSITLTSGSGSLAYFHVGKDKLNSCQKQIHTMLANNNFTFTEDANTAQIYVDYETTLEIGGIVPGELYDLNECYASLTLKIYNNQTQQLLMEYTVDRLRVLASIKNSAEQTKLQAAREVMKRVNRELPGKLRSLNLN